MQSGKILVWDLPVRVFHWLLAASFAGAWLTAESERLRAIHVALGYTMLGLIVFRVLWGLIGTRYARFGAFAFGPRRVLAYLKSLFTRAPQHFVGHNPAGSWAIYALIALTLATGLSGYAVYNDIGGGWTEEFHEFFANAMLAVVVVHVAGVVVSSLLHRENLVRAMIDGRKPGAPGEGIATRHRWIAAVLLVAVVGYWSIGTDLASSPTAAPMQLSADRNHDRHRDDD